MSATNLLNLNVDTLFEQHSVPEIDIVHKKIQEVVEKKREELRTMVGERYRDLLKAADTIAAMQQSSSTLIAQVDCIATNCRSLNEQQLIGFKTGDATDMLRNRTANKQLNNYFSTMVQIKLLMSLPELIWMHIDQERFYAATELFIFSRHISTGLQLDGSNALMQQLPVAKKQWEMLKPFHITIKQNLHAVLEREELSAELVVDVLLSLLVLEKQTLNSVFKIFLQLRCAAFKRCLTFETDSTSAMRRVKDRILGSFKVLNGTMELMKSCFLENGPLFQKLSECTDTSCPPTIALMDSNDTQFSYMLPEIIVNFRPKFDAQSLDSTHVRLVLEEWLTDTKLIAEIELSKLFALVTTMNAIQEIKAEANNYRKNLDFAPIVKQFQLSQPLDFYQLKYVPLINQRVHDIIRNSWAEAMESTFVSLDEMLKGASTQHEQHLWTEHSNELPLSLAEALNEDCKVKKLLMKTKGYDGAIIKLATQFDAQLESIVSELNVLLEEQTTRAEDKLALIEFLRATAQHQFTHFITRIKSLGLTAEQRNELLVVVRTCMALIELCPHLKICFCQPNSWRQWVGNVTGVNSGAECWQRMCLLLEEVILHFWGQIVGNILAENSCEQQMPNVVHYETMLEDFANWETVSLEQKDEQDNAVHSNFRIPNQPRISLHTYLFNLIGALSEAIPQTLPSKVLSLFNSTLLTQLLAHYRKLTAHESLKSSQNVALQLYFDLKFLQHIFAISREERSLSDAFQELQNTLKDNIDPFDFEIFAEHIAVNVKRCSARLNCQLGVLTPQSTAHASAAAPSLAQEKDPNVLSLSACGSTSLWFPLLPIISPNSQASSSSAVIESKKTASADTEKQTTPTRKTTATRRSDTAKSKSGAASFFGAMSQDWFR